MKHSSKDYLVGGLFTLCANVIAFVWLNSSFILPFDFFQQLTFFCTLFLPGCIYCFWTRKRTFFFSLGVLSGTIVLTIVSVLLSIPYGDAYINFVETLVFGEVGILFGIEFVLEFFLRIIALTVPPVIDLLVRGIRWLLHTKK